MSDQRRQSFRPMEIFQVESDALSKYAITRASALNRDAIWNFINQT
jgi:hypothetical protein